MKYALLIYNPAEGGPSDDELRASQPKWGQYTQDIVASGVFIHGEGLMPTDTATTVSVRDGQRVTTDGPFAETKEYLAGFYLVDVADLDAALELAERMPNAEYGHVEVRPLLVFDEPEVA